MQLLAAAVQLADDFAASQFASCWAVACDPLAESRVSPSSKNFATLLSGKQMRFCLAHAGLRVAGLPGSGQFRWRRISSTSCC